MVFCAVHYRYAESNYFYVVFRLLGWRVECELRAGQVSRVQQA